jgi:hypothetical protein
MDLGRGLVDVLRVSQFFDFYFVLMAVLLTFARSFRNELYISSAENNKYFIRHSFLWCSVSGFHQKL